MLLGEKDSSGIRVSDDVQVQDQRRGGRTRKCCSSGDSVSGIDASSKKTLRRDCKGFDNNVNMWVSHGVCPQGAQVQPVGSHDAEAGRRPGRFQDS